MLVFLAPGQGAPSPGLLLPWLDPPGARDDVAVIDDGRALAAQTVAA